MQFRNRVAAGQALAAEVKRLDLAAPVVLGVARGGVILAGEVARALAAPVDVLVPRKLPAPYSPEVAIGAVTEDGTMVLNQPVAAAVGADESYLATAQADALAEIRRRAEAYRGGRPARDLAGRTAVIVDDGVATGFTLVAAARGVRAARPQRLVIAVPVGASESIARLRGEADEIVCLVTPEPFYAVSQAYVDFDQVDDASVMRLLREHDPAQPASSPDPTAA